MLIYYFAYGSNMVAFRLRSRVRLAGFVCTGSLRNHTLTWDKVSKDGSGKCTLTVSEDPSDTVYGGLFAMNKDHLADLDRAEGLGHGYNHYQPEVEGHLLPETAQVITYIADETFRNNELKPYGWYHRLVMLGAAQLSLPGYYVEKLYEVPWTRDHNTERRRRGYETITH